MVNGKKLKQPSELIISHVNMLKTPEKWYDTTN